jgi:hypothetical protein
MFRYIHNSGRRYERNSIMRTQTDYPLVTAAIERFADWWKQRRDRVREFDAMSRPALAVPEKDAA